jgi:signal transduction histidine kinase
MFKPSLGSILLAGSVGLVAIAVAAFATVTTGLVRRFADDQAVARVDAAASALSQALGDEADDLRVTARLLGERPTLRRLLEDDDRNGAGTFLRRFAGTGDLDGWALLREGAPVRTSDPDVDWAAVLSALGPAGLGLVAGPDGGRPWTAAASPVPESAGWSVVVARRWDDPRLHALSNDAEFGIRLLDRVAAAGPLEDPALPLRLVALDGNRAASRVDDSGFFVGVAPLRGANSEVVAVAEATLPVESVDAPIRRLAHRIGLCALATAGLGAALAAWLTRVLARQVGDLAQVSTRIGAGDLDVPVPRVGIAEIGRLGAAMEDMRIRLGKLTSDLRRQSAEAESILAGTADGVLAVDRERTIRYLNPQAAARLGVPVERAVGRFCGDVLRPKEPDGRRPCEDRCPILDARFRGPSRGVEHLETAGGPRTVLVTSGPPTPGGSDEEAGRQIVVLRDETDAEAARRLRDAVVASVSHEFRTPLSAQRASLELLRERLQGFEGTAPLLRSLERGTLRLTQLIDNLLESLRIEAGRDTVRKERVDLDAVVEEAVEDTAPLLELRRQRVDVDLPHPLPGVSGDSVRLTQVFVNLLANANKFAPEGSSITIRGERRPGEIVVTVADEGPGLPSGETDRLFDRFIRSSSDEPKESGLGLGLWIVRSIVARHGGRVEALDAERGTKIAVILPAEGGREDSGR